MFVTPHNGFKTKEEVVVAEANLGGGGVYCSGIAAAISAESSRPAPVVNSLFTSTKAFVDGRL